jgi:hypothetical protein
MMRGRRHENSRQDYNVLFAEKDGTRSSSQIMAFEDTWEWNQESARAYEHVVEGGGRVAEAMIAFHTFLGASDMMAYLAMMAPRVDGTWTRASARCWRLRSRT